jgi:lipopolysaccharide export system protein LptA
MIRPPLSNTALLLLVLAPWPALALQGDREQPMDISADWTDATLGETGQALLKGNVVISQGSLRIESQNATIERDAGVIRRALLEGAPATLQQGLDAGGQMQARARGVDYDVVNEVLVMTGDVVVIQPEGELRGQRIRYDLKSGRMEGGGEGGRVQMRIQPRAAKPASPAG